MKKIRIAVIDSGLQKKQEDICDNIYNWIDEGDNIDYIGHGSAIIYLIHKYCNAQIEVHKIINRKEDVDEEKLINVLEFLYKNSLPDIINISMGITISEHKNKLERICKKLSEKGTIIVSAFANDGSISYPAAFECVIGVDTSLRCRNIHEYEYVDSDIVNIRGFGGEQRLPVKEGKYEIVSGTSFVAPLISAKIANWLSGKKLDILEIKEKLSKDAIYIYKKSRENKYRKYKSDMQKAILFPFNKEIYPIVSNQDLLQFTILKVCDIKNFGMVGKRISEILCISEGKDFIIENIERINWNDDFDTVILGHTREINNALHFDFFNMILNKCIKYKKRVYSFEGLKNNLFCSNDIIRYPFIQRDAIPKNRFGKLFSIACPVIGVFGTSSRQGKFTMQLKLRRNFLKENYNVKQLGTEPSSYLFGMECTYPMGYDGDHLLNGNNAIAYINNCLNEIVDEKTDVLIVGGQSQTTAYAGTNLNLFSLENLYLLLASQPDIVVLCVNSYDEDDYVLRTIKYIEGAIDTKIVAIVISPFVQIFNSELIRRQKVEGILELEAYKNHIFDLTGIPAFILNMSDDGRKIYEICIESLS